MFVHAECQPESLFEAGEDTVIVRMAHPQRDLVYAADVSKLIAAINTRRGKGVVDRPPAEIAQAMREGRCALALNDHDKVIGHMYLGVYREKGKTFLSNTGLVVDERYRGRGISKQLKAILFSLAQSRYPNAVMFSLTMNPQIVQANKTLGYRIKDDYSALPSPSSRFWEGCKSCPHYSQLKRSEASCGAKRVCECQALVRQPQQLESLVNIPQVKWTTPRQRGLHAKRAP